MSTQLQQYAAQHASVQVGRRTFTLEGVSQDGDIAVATLKGPRTAYHAVLCPKVRMVGYAGAEVWAVLGSRGRTVVQFALHEGRILEVHG